MLRKVVSGGQTGVDRAGLDATLSASIPVGGFCAKGRPAEDGVIPTLYPMTELDSPESCHRTERNVVESDGTLILNKGELTEGTRLTWEFTLKHRKPCLIVQLDNPEPLHPGDVVRWLDRRQVQVLNVAGPRESKCSGGIYREARRYLEQVFAHLKNAGTTTRQ